MRWVDEYTFDGRMDDSGAIVFMEAAGLGYSVDYGVCIEIGKKLGDRCGEPEDVERELRARGYKPVAPPYHKAPG